MKKKTQPLKLGVNIDHVATLRQARGTTYPDMLQAAECSVAGGAVSITVHLREDRRHIQDADVYLLKRELDSPINLEMANASEIVDIALDVLPEEVCLVPERREELTTEGGLDVVGQFDLLLPTVHNMTKAGIHVSMFIDPDIDQVRASADIGAPCIELHTGTFCDNQGDIADEELARLIKAAELAHELGLQVNAGHGIHLGNIARIREIPHLDTLNIGHSLVCRSVFVGLEEACREMLRAMNGQGGRV